MLRAYRNDNGRLAPLPLGADLAQAVWIDLYRPMPDQIAGVAALGFGVPTLEDMEEIEISNRFYREDGADVMTIVISGLLPGGANTAGPVTFLLRPERLVTVRHHAPRPFETFPERADRATLGCADATRVFLGLVEEIVARQADLLEGAGKALDQVTQQIFSGGEGARTTRALELVLQAIGREGEALSRIRLSLLSLERMLSIHSVWSTGERAATKAGERLLGPQRAFVKAQLRDIQALEVHADFLSGRVSLASDTTMGLINLTQSATMRILSVLSALFLPPTLIASVYGMNFAHMPELNQPWGYAAALGLMALSALGGWALFRWRGWT